jgi:hypothetical protein
VLAVSEQCLKTGHPCTWLVLSTQLRGVLPCVVTVSVTRDKDAMYAVKEVARAQQEPVRGCACMQQASNWPGNCYGKENIPRQITCYQRRRFAH